ncbi:uncharacterized protein G2W53_036829 [Senna tora]|uniref:Uncharacterized protein n=1 Tax=Senna tora TaxID=362788 RepID=A0A834SUM6_9FABA|nr:uncharacterized protein G2W53_036829 [Senna tora]
MKFHYSQRSEVPQLYLVEPNLEQSAAAPDETQHPSFLPAHASTVLLSLLPLHHAELSPCSRNCTHSSASEEGYSDLHDLPS